MTYLRSHSWEAVKSGFNPRSLGIQSLGLLQDARLCRRGCIIRAPTLKGPFRGGGPSFWLETSFHPGHNSKSGNRNPIPGEGNSLFKTKIEF